MNQKLLKKLTVLSMAFCLMGTVAACGGGGDDDSDSENNSTPPTSSSSTEAEAVPALAFENAVSTLSVGATYQLEASIYLGDDTVDADDDAYTFTSSDTSVLTCTTVEGENYATTLTALQNGTATVTVTAAYNGVSLSDTLTITVKDTKTVTVEGLTIDRTYEQTGNVAYSYYLNGALTTFDGTPTYEITDTSIATVSADGTVTALKNGTTTVKVTCGDAVGEGSVTVKVSALETEINSFRYADLISGENVFLKSPAGAECGTFAATTETVGEKTPADYDAAAFLKWTYGEGSTYRYPGIGFRGLAGDATYYKSLLAAGYETISFYAYLEVTSDKFYEKMHKDGHPVETTEELAERYLDFQGGGQAVLRNKTWTKVTISLENWIKAIDGDNNFFYIENDERYGGSMAANVYFTPIMVDADIDSRITASTTTLQKLTGKNTVALTMMHGLKELDATWTSSNTNVATVDADGVVTAVGTGTTTITATCGDDEQTIEITVEAYPVYITYNEINLETKQLILKDNTMQLVATHQGEAVAVEWTSSNPEVATVDENGLLTAVKAGTVTLTAVFDKELGNISKTLEVEVVDASSVELSSFTTDQTTILNGTNGRLTTVVTLNDSEVYTATVTYSVDDESVLAVAADGKFTALKAGTATITAQATCFGVQSETKQITMTVKDYESVVGDVAQKKAWSVTDTALEGTIVSAMLGEVNITEVVNLNAGKMSFEALANFSLSTGENQTLTVVTSAGTYFYRVNVWTNIIESAEEFMQIEGSTVNGCAENDATAMSGKYILANDIDFANYEGNYEAADGSKHFRGLGVPYSNGTRPDGVAYSNYSGWGDGSWSHGVYSFTGVLDGRGYTVKNVKVDIAYGSNNWLCVVGRIDTTAIIRDIGFEYTLDTTDMTNPTDYTLIGLIGVAGDSKDPNNGAAGTNRSLVSNVYANATVIGSGHCSTFGFGGIMGVPHTNSTDIVNCVAVVDVSGYTGTDTGENFGGITTYGFENRAPLAKIENCYINVVLGDKDWTIQAVIDGNKKTQGASATATSSELSVIAAGVTAGDGFSDVWSVQDGKLYFGDTEVGVVQSTDSGADPASVNWGEVWGTVGNDFN